MALHIRRQIRDAVALALAGLPTTGGNVFKSRVGPLPVEDLPALRIYTPIDRAERMSQGSPPRQNREVQVLVEAVVVAAEGQLEDTFDAIGVEVEAALGNSDLGVPVDDMVFVEAISGLSGEGEDQAGLLRMEFTATVSVAEGAPDAVLP